MFSSDSVITTKVKGRSALKLKLKLKHKFGIKGKPWYVFVAVKTHADGEVEVEF